MKMKSKKIIVLFSVISTLNILMVGCSSNPKSATQTDEAPSGEVSSEELHDMPSEDNGEDSNEPQEHTVGKWQVLEPEIAAAFDADFMGKVWKIEEDSFFIAERKGQILEDGSLASSSPSSNADIPDSQLIQVVFDSDTYFYIRTIYDNGDRYEDKEAGFQDLEEYMAVDMKGSFENDVFYATEIRLSNIS